MSFIQLSKLNRINSRTIWQKHFICILAAWITLSPAFSFALPTDPSIKAGSVTFNQVDPNTLHVIQSTNKAIIDWQTFNIQANEATHFQMPSSGSFNLSRVTGGVGSEIFGTLSSNGNLMLLNPNGILFGANSKIDVGGLIATTANISNENFMAGNFKFDIPSSIYRTVVNRGAINVAQGGLLAFVAPGVENSGIINAKLGQVSLASGKTFTLDLYGDKLVSLGVDSKVLDRVIGPDGEAVSSLIKNGGSIKANGGSVFLEVNAARDVVDNVINMDGLIEAKTAVQDNGEIILYGGEEGLVNVTGTLDASGKEAGQTAGEVQVLGEWVALLDNAFIDVSGDLGGGRALIGGDYQGKGLVPTSEKTYFHSSAFVTADALTSGDGGKVILWADDATYFKGSISAIGGFKGGNGGFVETSGKKYLDFDGSVDVAALNGEAGTVLLDPASITLLSGVDSNSTGFTAGSNISELFAEDSAAATVLNPDSGGSFNGISAGSTIILQATDFITVSNNFVLATATGNSNVNLVMQAGSSINVNANLTLDGTGTLHLEADSPHSSSGAADGTGAINIASGKTITAGGAVTLIGADFDLTGSLSAGSNNVTIGQSAAGTLALGTATSSILTDTELDNITTTGTITIGRATTKGSDGAGTSASTITSGAITLDELTLGSKNVTLVSSSTINDDDDTGTAIATTGTLTLTSGAAIGGSGGSQGLDIDVGTLAITGTGSGNVTVTEASGLVLGATTVGGTFSATATAGDITDSGVLAITGASTLTAANGQSITLDSSSTFTGAVSFASAGTLANVTINDSGAFELAALTLCGNLNVTAGGAVTQSGALVIPGTTTVSASGQDVTLNTSTNNFTGAVAITGANVSVVDAGALVLGASTVSGTFAATATASGDITNTGALAITGAATFTAAGGQSITVANASNNFASTVAFNSGGTLVNVSVLDTTAFDLAALSVSGTLTVSSGDAISQSGALTVGGTSSFTSTGSNDNITLSTNSNAMSGNITVSTQGTSGDVTIDNGTTALGIQGTVNGALDLTAGAAITDSNTLTVSGTSSFTIDNGSNHITLGTAALTGAIGVATSGTSNFTLDNTTTAVNLGTVGVTGALSVTSGATITDSGVVTVGGTATFVTDVNDIDIVLDSNNAITGAVTFTTQTSGSTNGADITFDNGSTAISLAAFTTEGNLTLQTDAAIALTGHTVNGALAVTSAAAISQSAALTVSGTSSFTSTGSNSNITLSTTSNALTGAVSASTAGSSGDVTIDNGTTALNIGASTIRGNLTVTAGDSITDSGVITVTGTASFTTDTSDKLITLNSQNAITGQVTFDTTSTGGDVTFDNGTTAITLGTIASGDIGGDLTLLTDADQTISNAITLGGSGAGLSITVDNANSLTVQEALTTNAGGITLSADDDVIFTAAGDLSSTNGNISVTADDDSTSDAESGGVLTMVDGTVFNAGSGTISGTADENITLGQLTTTNATSSAITLNTTSGNILDGDTSEANDLTAVSGTVSVTTGGGTFGTDANPIEITSASITKTGVPVTVVTPQSEESLSGTSETVGEASVDQTINIVGNLAMTVAQGKGNSSSTVSAGIGSLQLGAGPVIVDVFSQPYELVKVEGIDPQTAPAVNQLNDVWVSEENEN